MKIRSTTFSYARCVIYLMTLYLVSACSSRTTPAPVVEVHSGKTVYDRKQGSYAKDEYIVKRGDTLYSIAWISGNDYRDLARFNNIAPPYEIYPGQRLKTKQRVSNTPKPSPKPSGQTLTKNSQIPVDRTNKQAYGNSRTGQKLAKKQPSSAFPQRVERWQWPAKGKVISTFSSRAQGNKGVDIAGNRGTPIKAAAAGKVVYTGSALRGFGRLVIIKHSDKFLSAYAHNEKILVKEQQWVSAGQQIATMGDSDADRIMLHFEVRYKGKSVDPLRYLPK
ncbi:peptidoglycan DD-metalloendopeptidase family protein [Aestuariibacter sp. AA17]|uniref:Peptidoglycan DD-metalloendopeptidase family protein n=1 Tax=Fluctibacter corallii TaxID=2984329 RepID=A0ABT3A7M9_9ALTE|nr:peptidoglycan DD-metalloendopeptidase family protein [Aestuariibacter sp. AA17]MCV2884615.1 peptidoglycan DD-metalloendopeptidase family protein [Aestuariibacter sp. AA17]